MSRYCAEPSQGHDQQDETRVQSVHDFPVKAGFTGESDKFRAPSALARANAGFEAMAPCYGWRSPHTRGARGQALRRLGPRRIIPAYAGSTGPPPAETQRRLHHPRIRGEHDVFADQVAQTKGSSPHTRGAQQRERKTLMLTGIIPAYAGSTRHGHSHLLLYPDHPRIRGEHQSSARQCRWRDGSSPHTRGARLRPLKDFAPRPIIPAYAGSTSWERRRRVPAWDHPRIRGEHAPSGLPTR